MEQVSTVIHGLAAAVFVATMIYAGVVDVRSFQVPNWIPVVMVVAFFPAAIAKGLDAAAIIRHLGAGAAALAVGIVLALRWMGGGDAKLLAASAVWVGGSWLLAYALLVSLMGGVVALLLIAFRKTPLPSRLGEIGWVRRLHSEDQGIPYAVAIAAAALILFPRLPLVG